MCATCEAHAPFEPSEWFEHIFYFYKLQRGGYPFRRNDLSVEEWLGLGEMRDEIEGMLDAARAGAVPLK